MSNFTITSLRTLLPSGFIIKIKYLLRGGAIFSKAFKSTFSGIDFKNALGSFHERRVVWCQPLSPQNCSNQSAPAPGQLSDTSSLLFTRDEAQRLSASALCFLQRLVGSLLTTHGRCQIHPSASPEPRSLRHQNHQALRAAAASMWAEACNISLALTTGRRDGRLFTKAKGHQPVTSRGSAPSLCARTPQSRHHRSCESGTQLLPCPGP